MLRKTFIVAFILFYFTCLDGIVKEMIGKRDVLRRFRKTGHAHL